jgi:putative flippase GtrA
MFKLLAEVMKYAAASAVALGADAGLLYVLTRYAGWPLWVSGTTAFLAGASIAYVLSVRFVFHAHRLHSRRLEFTLFVTLGLAGVVINDVVLTVTVGRFGLNLLLAKAIAACFTFSANFALRRQLLFRTGTAPA